jgi:hypothetical protein
MMIDTDVVLQRIIDWQKSHGGTGAGLVVKQHRAVFDAAKAGHIPADAFLPLQCWAQLTGGHEPAGLDLVDEYPETRMGYSQSDRWNPNNELMDCSSWAHWNVYVWTGRLLVPAGTTSYTESQWKANKSKSVAWATRRAFDLPYWNFKKSEGRTASHVGILGGNGLLCQTTSPSNPLRIEADTYSASKRVGCVRFLTAAEYQSMFTIKVPAPTPIPTPTPVSLPPVSLVPGMKGPYVVMLQKALMKKGYKLPKWGADGSWGAETTAALLLLKKAAGLSSALLVGPKTWKALLS